MPEGIDITQMDKLKKHQLEKIAKDLNLGKIKLRKKS
jgi:hypothetical protein